jgi:hypothetical protein
MARQLAGRTYVASTPPRLAAALRALGYREEGTRDDEDSVPPPPDIRERILTHGAGKTRTSADTPSTAPREALADARERLKAELDSLCNSAIRGDRTDIGPRLTEIEQRLKAIAVQMAKPIAAASKDGVPPPIDMRARILAHRAKEAATAKGSGPSDSVREFMRRRHNHDALE